MGGILLIDAEQPFADQLTGSLTGRGFSVKLLDDGKDGLDYARDNKPDLIILCVELPKMSGYSICNKLKKDNDLKGIPLIITSKEATPETFAQHKKLKTRAEDYLIKPFSDGELVDKIGALLPILPILPILPADDNGAAATHIAATRSASPPPVPPDDAFDGLNALGSELAAGPSGDSPLDISAPSLSLGSSLAPLGLSAEDDALLASLDDLGSLSPHSVAAPRDPLDLGLARQDDDGLDGLDGLDEVLRGLSPEAALDALEEVPAPAPAPAPVAAPVPRAAASSLGETSGVLPRAELRNSSVPSTSAADFQQVQSLRRDNTELKSKVGELEARLKAAEDSARAAKDAVASAASGGGSSAREVLNLKEQLRTKEREIGALKDEVFERDKSAVDLGEQIDKVRAETFESLEAAKSRDVELSTLQAKLKAVEEERDDLEQQVHGQMRQGEAERDEARVALDGAQAELQVTRASEGKLALAETRIQQLEDALRKQEDAAVKAAQRLKTEESRRDKTKNAVELALALLSGDTEVGGTPAELDAE